MPLRLSFLLCIAAIVLAAESFAQTTVFTDDFNRAPAASPDELGTDRDEADSSGPSGASTTLIVGN